MHRIFVTAFAAVLILGSVNSANAVQLAKHDAASITEHRYRDAELLVKFRAAAGVAQIQGAATAHGAHEVRPFIRPSKLRSARIDRWNLVKLNAGMDAKQARELFARDPNVERVELNYEVSIDATPNDPRFGELWGLHNIGQSGRADVDIDAPEAWDINTGSDAVIVGVIDTGVDYTHPDLAANMWVNPGEIAGNGLDDDANGYVDDIYGYDFYNRDNNPFDDHGHGTHVAGTIAAVGNNGIGVVGVNWQAKIMALKFLGAGGSGSASDAIGAILYAADKGARILNNSWGGGPYLQSLRDAIATANSANILFVAAAGNSNRNNDMTPHYPSSYDVPNVLAVAATDSADARAGFSSYGATTVDMGAPGVGILSTVPPAGNSCCSNSTGYMPLNGTSMASPHVAGAAALLLADNPLRGATELKYVLMSTGDAVPSMRDVTVSGNRLNVDQALRCVPGTLHVMANSPGANFVVYQNESAVVSAIVHNCGATLSDAQVLANFTGGDAPITLYDDGLHSDGLAGDGVYANTWTPTTLGPVSISISATHGALGSGSDQADGRVIRRVTYQYSAAPYQWIDTTGGSSYGLSDESGIVLSFGFPFEFYGLPINSLLISSNGYLNFQSTITYDPNVPLPAMSRFPYSMVAPLWTNLNPGAGGRVYSLQDGIEPNRRFTVAWVGVPYSGIPNSNVSFQVTLYEGSNDIVFQYQDVDFGNSLHNFGASATIGVQNQNGVYASQYAYRQPVLRNGTAIRFRPGDNNGRPIASPGAGYSTFMNVPVTFNGTGSDPENAPLTYRWDFGDGTTGTGPNPTHAYASKGTFRPFLIVNDGVQDSAPAVTTVTVLNRTPVANVGGPYNGVVGTPIAFNGSRSTDADGDALTYSWNFGDGTTGTGVAPSKTYTRRGTYTVRLTVSDGAATSTATTTATLANRAPTANAGGPYNGLVNTPIAFTGAGSSDPDNDPLTYSWNFGDGSTGTGVNSSKSYASKGTFTVTLTVSDGLLSSAPATATVTIGNRAPTANAGGPYTGDVGVAVAFTGTASDADGDTLTYNWDFGDGGTGTGANTSHVYTAKGSYTATLTVNDGTDNSAPATATVTIRNRAPVANAGGPYTSYVGTALNLDGSRSSDPDSDTLTYRWDFGDGTTGTGVRPLHTYAARGSYTVTLIVNDGSVDSSAATTTVSVPNRNPAANAGGPYSGFIGVPVTLNGSGSDADGDALTYSWNFGDNTTGVGANPSHSYSAKGTYTVSLIVNDGSADSAPSTGTVMIGNRAPSAHAGGPYSGGLTAPITFNGSASSDPDGDILSYAWNFGDGSTGAGVNPTHLYAAPGTYTVSLIVNDGSDSSTVASSTVTIANQAPTANAGVDRTIRKTTSNVYLDGRASADSDGTIASYRWRQVSGYAVTLYNATAARPYFRMSRNIRPLPQNLVFELTVTDNFGAIASDTVTITVRN